MRKKGITLTKKWRDLQRKGTHKHMEIYFKYFDDHRCLLSIRTHGKDGTMCHFYRVFTYVYSLLIEKDICDCQNIQNKFPCVCVCVPFLRRSLHFSVRVFPFFPIFYVIRTLVLSFPCGSFCTFSVYQMI